MRNFGTRLGYIPPLGPVGASSQTQAGQLVLAGRSQSAQAGIVRSRKKGRRKLARRKMRATRRATRTTRKLKRLVKGSRAAKAYMAKLRRKRRR